METKFTPGTHSHHKCRCGHPACNQYILSTQGSSGFSKADADLYVAAPDMYAALDMVDVMFSAPGTINKTTVREVVRAALAKARGQA